MQKLKSLVGRCGINYRRKHPMNHDGLVRPCAKAYRLFGMVCLGWAMVTASGGAQAVPVSVIQNISFKVDNESFWGGGTGYKFGSAGEFGPSAVNFSWDIGASSGTVDASVSGGLKASFDTLKRNTGLTPLSLSFSGLTNGGALSSELGAWAKSSVSLLGATLPLIDYGFKLDPNTTFTPVLGQSYAAKDFDALAGTGVDIGIFSTGVNFGVAQDESLLLESITGTLKYGLKNSGTVNSLPFLLGSTSSAALTPLLSTLGVWEFWIADLELNALFSTDFDLSLRFYETHPDGIEWCSRKVWGFKLSWPCGLAYDKNEWEAAALNVYDGKPFHLNFDTTMASPWKFAILVVPEPPMWLLLAPAFLTLLATRRRVVSKTP